MPGFTLDINMMRKVHKTKLVVEAAHADLYSEVLGVDGDWIL